MDKLENSIFQIVSFVCCGTLFTLKRNAIVFIYGKN